MKETRQLMGMPVSVEIVDPRATTEDAEVVFSYLTYVDQTFSTYQETSEISQVNAGTLPEKKWSADLRFVLKQCALIKQETNGYFDIEHNGKLDPSGYVKGWAIQESATLLEKRGQQNFCLEIAGDMQLAGHNSHGELWSVGIRNPFDHHEIVKRLRVTDCGVATSGTAVRGQHIYNPLQPNTLLEEIVSLTVIGPTIIDADCYATAAFAMGRAGITFIASKQGFAGYAIDKQGVATFTPGFTKYIEP